MSDFDELLQDVIRAAGEVVTAYEWGTGVAPAQKELAKSIAALKAEWERKDKSLRAWKKAAKKWRTIDNVRFWHTPR